ncbi:MAG TPA: DUF2268 domain-containing putative Zn-dependent protease [Candidatus Moranbacteria bacterium]|nr:DUF2268 domain-containing putative Zn-dependent protease [Candidatus Moranbacteria bacterium]
MESKLYIHFLKTESRINPELKEILEETIKIHAAKACDLLGISYVNITVYSNPNFVIPETGEGGYAVSGDWFQIYIDPTRPEKDLVKIINENIPLTTYHELNHVARWNSTGYGSTFPEAIISEGLASVFAAENWDKANSPWVKYSQEEIEKLIEIYKNRDKNLDSGYSHDDWFYGTGDLPRWIGYKLGFQIVKIVCENNPEIEWKKLAKMKAKELMKISGVIGV